MIIEIIDQIYRCGCGGGMVINDYPGVLKDLNSVMEWDKCKFPNKETENKDDPKVENRQFLGDIPELKPGNCFYWEGQIFAIDSEDRLALLFSETGPGACDRFYRDALMNEKLFNSFKNSKISYKFSDDEIQDKDKLSHIKIKFPKYKLWLNKFGRGRIPDTTKTIEIIVESDKLWFPVTVFMEDDNIYYNSEEIDDEIMNELSNEIMGWFFANHSTLVLPKKEEPKIEARD